MAKKHSIDFILKKTNKCYWPSRMEIEGGSMVVSKIFIAVNFFHNIWRIPLRICRRLWWGY